MSWAGAARLKAKVGESNQRELAKLVNVSPSALNNYLSGRRSPDPDTLARICKALSVSADWVLGLGPARAEEPVRTRPPAPEPEEDTGLIRRRILGMLAKLEKGDLKRSDRELLEELDRRVAALEKKRAVG